MRKVYLDSSVLVKRYVEEKGSDIVDLIYSKSEVGKIVLVFSAWNIGEVLGVLDKYLAKKAIGPIKFRECVNRLLLESIKMVRLGSLFLYPLTSDILVHSWGLVLEGHLYEADALQIASAKSLKCDVFLSADSRLLGIAKAEGLEALNPEQDQRRIVELLR